MRDRNIGALWVRADQVPAQEVLDQFHHGGLPERGTAVIGTAQPVELHGLTCEDQGLVQQDTPRERDQPVLAAVDLSTIVEAGGTGVVSPQAFGLLFSTKLPPFTPPRSDEESRRLIVEALREAGEHAVSVGAVVYLEPLNRYEDFVVNTLADAASIVDEVDSAGVRVIADTFHMSVEESDIGAAIRQTGSRIGHVQLGDSNRFEPGAGHYDWPETLAALESIGYDGWLAMECGLSAPVEVVLPKVAALLTRP